VFNNQDRLLNTFELYQNNPNPFTTSTLVAFYLPESGATTLSIHDLSGKVLYEYDGDLSNGYHSLPITREQLGDFSGVLTYTLRSGEYTATRRMVIVNKD
jgi:hypothetical protein